MTHVVEDGCRVQDSGFRVQGLEFSFFGVFLARPEQQAFRLELHEANTWRNPNPPTHTHPTFASFSSLHAPICSRVWGLGFSGFSGFQS